ncbi:MAG TPA: TlpA disulfide reductase family protein [Thermoanaerobaculia bacterium]|jgi:thiol-disulfide isomerase/thioredoxin
MSRLSYVLSLLLLVTACKRAEQPAAPTRGAQPQTTTTAPATATTTAATETSSGTEIGQQMPAYSADYLDGKHFDIANRKGQVVLLNLWATWCGPCRVEIPELEELHKELSGKGFEVVGVSVDEYPAAEIQKFVDQYKMTYPIVLDPEGKLANVLQTTVLPTTVLLDRKGKIVWKNQGLVTKKDPELMRAIDAALKS